MSEDTIPRRKVLKAAGASGLVGITGLSGCVGSITGENQTTLKYAHPNSPDSIVGWFASTLAEKVEERTDGQVKINVHPSSQLGGVSEMIQGASQGSIAMGHNDFSALGQLYKKMSVFNIPYQYEDREHLMRATDAQESPVLQELNETLIEETDIRVIGGIYYGRRQLTLNSAAQNPGDLDGKKVRAIPLDVFLATVRGLGAQPESVDFSELPSALATGVVDGQENPLVTIWANNFHEHQSHLMMTSHQLIQLPVYINEGMWQDIGSDNQETMTSTIRELRQQSLAKGVKKENELSGKLEEKGMTIIGQDELEMEKFRESVRNEVENEFGDWSDLMSRIEDL